MKKIETVQISPLFMREIEEREIKDTWIIKPREFQHNWANQNLSCSDGSFEIFKELS